jgi:DNA-binding MarR family transcriptional regulator
VSDRLSESEEQAWRSWIMATRKLYAHLGQEIQDEFGLPMGDYEILVRLSEGPDQRLRMSELAKITLASRSRLTHQIDRMEKAGLVRREANPDDRRGLFAVLTDSGLRTLNEAAPFHVEGVRRNVFDILTPEELATVARVSEKVNRHLDGER